MGIKQKLPIGKIFELESNSNLYKFLSCFDSSLTALQNYTKQIITDLDPRYTDNFIDEWARLLDIESEVDSQPTIADKRNYIYNALTTYAIKTQQYFIDLILTESGYTASIFEYSNLQTNEETGSPVQSIEHDNDASYTIVFKIETTDNNTELEFMQTGDESGGIVSASGIFDVESQVLKEFPLTLNIVFRYDDGTLIHRNF